MILAADIGGTKSLLALCQFNNGNLSIMAEEKFNSKDLTSLEELVWVFLDKNSIKPVSQIHAACFSLAGPIRDDYCELVNLSKTMVLKDIREALCFIPKITFCNDLVALANGLSILSNKDLFCLTSQNLSVKANDQEMTFYNKAVIAPGTGLGEAMIIENTISPSEGAHCDFAPRTEEEVRLWRFLRQRFGHVSYERIISGPGLQNIYMFLLHEKQSLEFQSAEKGSNDREVEETNIDTGKIYSPTRVINCKVSTKANHREWDKCELTPEEISTKALQDSCPICKQALHLFTSILGTEAGNLALKTLALGGVYIGGGIPPHILPKLIDGTFINAFRDKGRFSSLMEQIPVYIIRDHRTALYGAALLAKAP